MFEMFIKLNSNHITAATNMVAESFMDNPLLTYVFPDLKVRKKVLPLVYQIIIELVSALGEVYVTSKNIEGIFLVRRVGKNKLKLSHYKAILMAGIKFTRLIKHIPFVNTIKRALKIRNLSSAMNYYSKIYSKYIVLEMIAVDKKYREQKYMSKMMRALIEEVDRNGTFCLLETETETNTQIYQHFGFKLLKKVDIIEGQLSFYILAYDPHGLIQDKDKLPA